MLGWAIAFFVLALIAAVLGFGGIAGASAGIAKILFFVFLSASCAFIRCKGCAWSKCNLMDYEIE